MHLDDFHTEQDGKILILPQQASDFAKQIANDFNPIHDPDAKRFCVPGDLLFSLVLSKYGLSSGMCFTFSGMVGKGVTLNIPASNEERLEISDDRGKVYLTVDRKGDSTRDQVLTSRLIKAYVAFSGHNFPHVLIPLLSEQGVMINPERPLVIYEKMSLELDRLDIQQPSLMLTDAILEVNGKRGDVQLHFSITADGQVVGKGVKKLVVSGLRPFAEEDIDQMIGEYNDRKVSYANGTCCNSH